MRILLTGGAGYVGSSVLRSLVSRGHEPIAFDDLSEGNRAAVPDDRLVVGDIRDFDAVCEALRSHRIDAVMHFAALASVPLSIADPKSYYSVNVLGTKTVLDAMVECGVDRILFSSTAATFSFAAEMPLVEESPQIPEVPYGSTKLAAERMLQDYSIAYGLGVASLRYFNACGADLDGEFGECREDETHLIPLILQVPLGHREKVFVFGGDFDTRDGSCVRDYIHVLDLAEAHRIVLENLSPGNRLAYNLGSGTGDTVLEVLRMAEKVVGNPIAHEIVDRRPGDPGTLVASPDRIVRELGWNPKHSDIETVIQTAWDWHSRYPRGYADKQA